MVYDMDYDMDSQLFATNLFQVRKLGIWPGCQAVDKRLLLPFSIQYFGLH